MKKAAAFISAAVMAFSLASCGSRRIGSEGETSKNLDGEEMAKVQHDMIKTVESTGMIVDNVKYLGDDLCNDEMIDNLREMELITDDMEVSDCLGYVVEYHCSKNPIKMIPKLFSGSFDTDEHDTEVWYVKIEKDGYDSEWSMVSMGDKKVG